MTALYALSAVGGSIRYIGKTSRPLRTRLLDHLSEARNGKQNHRCKWLRSVGLAVQIDLIEEVAGNGSAEEIALIAGLRGLGLKLVNGTDGGEGMLGFKVSEESRAKMRLAKLGRKHSAETIARRLASPPVISAETRAKKIANGLRIRPSEQALANMRAAQAGHPVSPATRAKLSAALRGQPGHPQSVETRLKISNATKGKPKPQRDPVLRFIPPQGEPT